MEKKWYFNTTLRTIYIQLSDTNANKTDGKSNSHFRF